MAKDSIFCVQVLARSPSCRAENLFAGIRGTKVLRMSDGSEQGLGRMKRHLQPHTRPIEVLVLSRQFSAVMAFAGSNSQLNALAVSRLWLLRTKPMILDLTVSTCVFPEMPFSPLYSKLQRLARRHPDVHSVKIVDSCNTCSRECIMTDKSIFGTLAFKKLAQVDIAAVQTINANELLNYLKQQSRPNIPFKFSFGKTCTAPLKTANRGEKVCLEGWLKSNTHVDFTGPALNAHSASLLKACSEQTCTRILCEAADCESCTQGICMPPKHDEYGNQSRDEYGCPEECEKAFCSTCAASEGWKAERCGSKGCKVGPNQVWMCCDCKEDNDDFGFNPSEMCPVFECASCDTKGPDVHEECIDNGDCNEEYECCEHDDQIYCQPCYPTRPRAPKANQVCTHCGTECSSTRHWTHFATYSSMVIGDVCTTISRNETGVLVESCSSCHQPFCTFATGNGEGCSSLSQCEVCSSYHCLSCEKLSMCNACGVTCCKKDCHCKCAENPEAELPGIQQAAVSQEVIERRAIAKWQPFFVKGGQIKCSIAS
jgi:hypothetical protein